MVELSALQASTCLSRDFPSEHSAVIMHGVLRGIVLEKNLQIHMMSAT